MPTFDLIREPWIPCLRPDGAIEEAGLRDALCRAHELRAVRDGMPTVEFGLYRLLVVLVLDIFRPEDAPMLGALMDEGRFDPAQVDAYFTKWGDRFDLFSQTHPFLQTAGMTGTKDVESVRNLLHTMFTGQSGRHFHHYRDDFAVSPAVAAKVLSSVSAFALNGGRSYSAGLSGAPPWYALIDAENLFSSLCLNTYVLPMSDEFGVPAWRDDQPITNERRSSTTFLEALTWGARRVQIIPEMGGVCSVSGQHSDTLVRSMTIAGGFMLADDMKALPWRDPNVAYRTNKEVQNPLRPEAGKGVWRDTAPLFLLTERDYGKEEKRVRYQRPAIVSQFIEMLGDYLDKTNPLCLSLYGLRANLGDAKVFEWYREALSLPIPLVLLNNFHLEVQGEMERAGDVDYALRKAIKLCHTSEERAQTARQRNKNDKALLSLMHGAQRQFWAELRPAYDRFLREIAPLPAWQKEGWEEVRARWWSAIRKAGTAALGQAIGDLDADAGALKRQVLAEKSFASTLFTLLMTDDEKAARDAKKKAKPGAQKTKGEPAV